MPRPVLLAVDDDPDVLRAVEPIGPYEEVHRRAITLQIFDKPVRVISLDDLIEVPLPGRLPGVAGEPDAPRIRGGADFDVHSEFSLAQRSTTTLVSV